MGYGPRARPDHPASRHRDRPGLPMLQGRQVLPGFSSLPRMAGPAKADWTGGAVRGRSAGQKEGHHMYDIVTGDRAYSSWSLRGWLMLDAFGLPARTTTARMYEDGFAATLRGFAPARTVPALRLPDGGVVWDTLAIAETLAERHPEAGLWPAAAADRALARSMVAEMHSSYGALRSACPMNLMTAFDRFSPPDAARADLARIAELWALAPGFRDGWLFGAYSLADVVFAPVATRIATYGLPVPGAARDYVARHLAHPSFRRWRAMGLAENRHIPAYFPDLPRAPWPGPAPLAAEAVAGGTAQGPAENPACPYSGKPVTHLLRLDGRTFGFCNAFCRDKTVADPEAWPAFMALVAG
jgi:glutathione S-transferase